MAWETLPVFVWALAPAGKEGRGDPPAGAEGAQPPAPFCLSPHSKLSGRCRMFLEEFHAAQSPNPS